MFDFVYRKKRIVQVILALITLPFAFFGVDYYFRTAGSVTEIAKVGGDRITQAEYAETVREQQDRMRQALRDGFRVPDSQLAQFISALPAFQQDGKFSRTRYEQLLASQNMNPSIFE